VGTRIHRLVARRIAESRKASGLSPRELATLVGVSERAVRFWETADRLPSILELCRVAVFTDTTLTSLLFEVDEQREAIARG